MSNNARGWRPVVGLKARPPVQFFPRRLPPSWRGGEWKSDSRINWGDALVLLSAAVALIYLTLT